jgi:N-acetyl-anhydromuramyl-L-alanine amidase AmpD
MNTIIDEILQVPVRNKIHSKRCACSKCQSKQGEVEDSEFMDWLTGGVNDILTAFKRKFHCSIVDLTAKAKPKSTTINSRKTPRDLTTIDAVVLHQMAFSRGSDLNRYLRVGSHFIIMPDGKVGQLYPFATYLNASNTLNRRSVAIEFAGNFPNTRNQCWNATKFGCHQLTQQQIDAGRCLLSHLKDKLPSMKHVFAHRQSSASRSNDPGPAIWRNVAEWAISNLGYDGSSRAHAENRGRPIPADWRTP